MNPCTRKRRWLTNSSLDDDQDEFSCHFDPLGLPFELVNIIHSYASGIDLLNWNDQFTLTQRVQHRIQNLLGGPSRYPRFVRALQSSNGVISGSVLLHAIRDDQHLAGFDIDCFVPCIRDQKWNPLTDYLWEQIGKDEKRWNGDFYVEQGIECHTYVLPDNQIKVQVVTVITDPRNHIRGSFDFDCVKMWFDGVDLHIEESAKVTIKTNTIETELKYKFPDIMLKRIIKYHKKGFVNIGPQLTHQLRHTSFYEETRPPPYRTDLHYALSNNLVSSSQIKTNLFDDCDYSSDNG